MQTQSIVSTRPSEYHSIRLMFRVLGIYNFGFDEGKKSILTSAASSSWVSAASLRLRNSSSVTETGVIESISTWNTRKYKELRKRKGDLEQCYATSNNLDKFDHI